MKKKRYYYDTEFIEWAGGIDMISIGIITEDGREFYAEHMNFNPENADEWVHENVIKKLTFWGPQKKSSFAKIRKGKNGVFYNVYGSIESIKKALLHFIGEDEPELWAYYAAYDHVVLSRIFGRMIDLPKHIPMFTLDLKQKMEMHGLDKEWKRKNCPDPEGEHDAKADAKWNQKLDHMIDKYISEKSK